MKLNYNTYLPLAKLTESAYQRLEVPSLEPHNAMRLVHMALGLATEALELQSHIARGRAKHEQVLELSDLCWFSALAAEELGVPYKEEHSGNIYPNQGIQRVYELCELFASRIKAALIYGSPIKKTDPSPDYWKTIPAEIFGRVIAIGDAQSEGRGILQINIDKLKARYGDKFTAHNALHRDESREVAKVFTPPSTHKLATAAEIAEVRRAIAPEQDMEVDEEAGLIIQQTFVKPNQIVLDSQAASGIAPARQQPTGDSVNLSQGTPGPQPFTPGGLDMTQMFGKV